MMRGTRCRGSARSIVSGRIDLSVTHDIGLFEVTACGDPGDPAFRIIFDIYKTPKSRLHAPAGRRPFDVRLLLSLPYKGRVVFQPECHRNMSLSCFSVPNAISRVSNSHKSSITTSLLLHISSLSLLNTQYPALPFPISFPLVPSPLHSQLPKPNDSATKNSQFPGGCYTRVHNSRTLVFLP